MTAPRPGPAGASSGPPPSSILPAERLLDAACTAMRGTVARGSVPRAEGARNSYRGAAADSRQVRPGSLFFALSGERVDGFDFCGLAERAGAAAVVVEARRGPPSGVAAIPVIFVEDPRAALADLARAIRLDFAGRVVGITGSNGKTTTKELCAAALGTAGAPGSVLRTAGNLNTEIGLPLTILSSTGREAFWVLEMAMRGRGQIAFLADIAKPDVGLITNVAAAHLEALGSLEEVARAKGELFAGLGPEGIAVLPGGDPLIDAQAAAAHVAPARQRRFQARLVPDSSVPPEARPPMGSPSPARLDVEILEAWSAGAAGQVIRFRVGDEPVVTRLPLVGAHNAVNAAAALAVASALGVPAPAAARALADTVLPPHRSAPRTVAERVVVDDCYNANRRRCARR